MTRHMKMQKVNIFKVVATCLASAFFVAIIVVSAIITYAKYFTDDRTRTVSNGNGFYFSSDYLSEVVVAGDYSEYAMYGWDGQTDKSFAFVVRNYENPLLYNQENQDVSYHISYEVDDTYKNKMDVTLYRRINGVYTEENLDGFLAGGKENYKANEYKLTMKSKPGEQITEDVAVLIKVETIDSPYKKTLATKVILKYSEYAKFLSSKGFIEEDDNDYAFRYQICTANASDLYDMENSDATAATKTLHVWWDTNYVTFDRFDKRQKEMFTVLHIGEGGITIDNMKTHKNVIIFDDVNNRAHIYFDALPFSEFNIYLYKVKGISDAVWNTLADEDIVDTEVVE